MMRGGYMKNAVHLVALGCVSIFMMNQANAAEIAGLKPNMRPEQAPVVAKVNKDSSWYTKALTGVIPPYPPSLKFIEDQGNWFNPFIRPGMVGRYDIRGWHKS